MSTVYKFLNSELSLSTTTGNNVHSAGLVRLVNPINQASLITQQYANGSTKATFTMVHDSDLILIKATDDLLIANNSSVTAVPVAYRN
jgi:hypothetical protein